MPTETAQNEQCSKRGYLCPRPPGPEKEGPPVDAPRPLQTPFPPSSPDAPKAPPSGFLYQKLMFLHFTPPHPRAPKEPLHKRLKGLRASEPSDLGFFPSQFCKTMTLTCGG